MGQDPAGFSGSSWARPRHGVGSGQDVVPVPPDSQLRGYPVQSAEDPSSHHPDRFHHLLLQRRGAEPPAYLIGTASIPAGNYTINAEIHR